MIKAVNCITLKKQVGLLFLMIAALISCEEPLAVYNHSSPVFSVVYPAKWYRSRSLLTDDVFGVTGADGYTSLVINVSYETEYGEESASRDCILALQKMYPGSFRHKVLLLKGITLEDGTKAIEVLVSCKLEKEMIFLVSSNVVAHIGTSVVMVTGATLAHNSFDDIIAVTHSLKFEKR